MPTRCLQPAGLRRVVFLALHRAARRDADRRDHGDDQAELAVEVDAGVEAGDVVGADDEPEDDDDDGHDAGGEVALDHGIGRSGIFVSGEKRVTATWMTSTAIRISGIQPPRK